MLFTRENQGQVKQNSKEHFISYFLKFCITLVEYQIQTTMSKNIYACKQTSRIVDAPVDEEIEI